jgi:glyoxylase-like metal-dependent hydrolase (beta-lactamase superfamily II)
VVLDESDPNIKELGDHHAPSTVSAYWVHHPTEGDYLIDAGLARAFAHNGGNYTALLRLLLALFGAESRSTDGADVASQLRSRGISPRAVFLTHLHGDHTSGLVDLPALVPAVFGRGDDTFMQKAMIGDHLDGRPLYALDFGEAPAQPPFEHVLDLLGDSSIWAISTRGHSPNHVSYFVNAQSGPVLITGDACAYHAQFEHRIRPSPGVDDQEAAIRSLAGLRELYDRFPQLQVMVGHEPPQRR